MTPVHHALGYLNSCPLQLQSSYKGSPRVVHPRTLIIDAWSSHPAKTDLIQNIPGPPNPTSLNSSQLAKADLAWWPWDPLAHTHYSCTWLAKMIWHMQSTQKLLLYKATPSRLEERVVLANSKKQTQKANKMRRKRNIQVFQTKEQGKTPLPKRKC